MNVFFIYVSGMKCGKHPLNLPVGFWISLFMYILSPEAMKIALRQTVLHLTLV